MIDKTKTYICGYMDQYETWTQDESHLAYDERVITEMWDVERSPIKQADFVNYLRDRKSGKDLTVIIYVAISR